MDDITMGELARRLERLEKQLEEVRKDIERKMDEQAERWRRWVIPLVFAFLTPTVGLVVQAVVRK